jgi:hypothetical protein
MTAQFSVGQKVQIVIAPPSHPELRNAVTEITDVVAFNLPSLSYSIYRYRVAALAQTWTCAPHVLRPIDDKPDTTSWDEIEKLCGWNPTKIMQPA